MIVRQVIPRVAVGTVVLPDRAPLPLADIRAPPVPLPALQQPVLQPTEVFDPLTFRTHRHSLAVITAPSRAPSPERNTAATSAPNAPPVATAARAAARPPASQAGGRAVGPVPSRSKQALIRCLCRQRSCNALNGRFRALLDSAAGTVWSKARSSRGAP